MHERSELPYGLDLFHHRSPLLTVSLHHISLRMGSECRGIGCYDSGSGGLHLCKSLFGTPLSYCTANKKPISEKKFLP